MDSSATLGALTGLPACRLHSHYRVRSHIWPRRRTSASIVSTTVTAYRADRIHEKYAHMVTLMLVPSSPR